MVEHLITIQLIVHSLIDLGSTSESVDSSLLLFDCGNNVYKKLREIDEVESNIIKRIKYVFISHMDDDHIGSLKTLIYYNYFVNNKIMQIICGSEVYPSLVKYLEDVDGFVDNYEKIQTNLFYMVSLEKTRDWNLDNNVKLNGGSLLYMGNLVMVFQLVIRKIIL